MVKALIKVQNTILYFEIFDQGDHPGDYQATNGMIVKRAQTIEITKDHIFLIGANGKTSFSRAFISHSSAANHAMRAKAALDEYNEWTKDIL